ncbi:hypothetical protein JCM10908_003242 [Rhodotorula pacifica]|uniref:uncharacterized protein n=1 Tax=Rhodotorula pacifica TaxID=1495444 RepID=UPI00316D5B6E
MPRPNSAQILASQLEQAMAFYASAATASTKNSPSASSSSPVLTLDPPESSTPSLVASPTPSQGSTTPLMGSSSEPQTDSLMRTAISQTRAAKPGRPTKSALRPAPAGQVRRAATTSVGTKDEEELSMEEEDLDLELGEFGYGARGRGGQGAKKESLLDILNSVPPPWLKQSSSHSSLPLDPSQSSLEAKRSLTTKLRQRLRASTTTAAIPARKNGHRSALSASETRSGSKEGAGEEKEDPKNGLTTLRGSRSSGSLLASLSLRGRSSAKPTSASDAVTTSASAKAKKPASPPPPPQILPFSLPPLTLPLTPSASPPPKLQKKEKLRAKSAVRDRRDEEDSTRELVEFLHGHGRGPSPPYPKHPSRNGSGARTSIQGAAPPQKGGMERSGLGQPGGNRLNNPARSSVVPVRGARPSPLATAQPVTHSATPSPPSSSSSSTGSPTVNDSFQFPPGRSESQIGHSPTKTRQGESGPYRADSDESVISYASIQRTPTRPSELPRRISRKPVPSVVITGASALENYTIASPAVGGTIRELEDAEDGDDETVEFVDSPVQFTRDDTLFGLDSNAAVPRHAGRDQPDSTSNYRVQVGEDAAQDDHKHGVRRRLQSLQAHLAQVIKISVGRDWPEGSRKEVEALADRLEEEAKMLRRFGSTDWR